MAMTLFLQGHGDPLAGLRDKSTMREGRLRSRPMTQDELELELDDLQRQREHLKMRLGEMAARHDDSVMLEIELARVLDRIAVLEALAAG